MNSGLETKAMLNMGCWKTQEFSACSFFRIETQTGEATMQARYLGVVMHANNEQNFKNIWQRYYHTFTRQMWTKNILLFIHRGFSVRILLIVKPWVLRAAAFNLFWSQNLLRIWGKLYTCFHKKYEISEVHFGH